MKSLYLIIQREYFSRIKKKSFIIITLCIPFLSAALIFLPLLLAQVEDTEEKHIIIIDQTGLYAPYFQSSSQYSFDLADNNTSDSRSKIGKEIFGILQITGDLSQTPNAATFLSEKQVPLDLLGYINQTLTEVTKRNRLTQYTQAVSVDEEVVQSIREILESKNKIAVSAIRLNQDGDEKESSVKLASGLGLALILFMYMFIMAYGAMVMQSVIEEKTNRIVEVMISSVRPFYLMMGKIIGIGLVGFTQLFTWIVMGGVLMGVSSSLMPAVGAGAALSYVTLLSSVNWVYILGFFILFFIGGYLIYAAIFAMFASAVDNAQDSQQFMMPVTLIFIFALYTGIYSVNNPDGPLAFWCSIIPLTSPIVMMVRIPAEVALWEMLLSLVILYGSVILTTKFAAKVYRIGILMYGKKPSLKEVFRWAKYK
ncbi:ABC transporter permease [Viscerimonas tarda]